MVKLEKISDPLITTTTEVVDLKQTKMKGPTFRALKEYFEDWGKQDPTLFIQGDKNSQRDCERKRGLG